MIRNKMCFKPLSVEAAADIEVNTNFILPKHGMVRKANQYRKSQRDINRANSLTGELQEPPKRSKLSEVHSQNYKNFIFADSPRVASYENLKD